MDTFSGEQLINELLADPAGFEKQGKAYELLQQYFKGFSLDSLRPLLKSSDKLIQSAAIFVVSELGSKGASLIKDVIPLIGVEDRSIQYSALETVMVCSVGENVDAFKYVVFSMEAADQVIRVLSMRLVSNANDKQLKAVDDNLNNDINSSPNFKIHRDGLSLLIEGELSKADRIGKMMYDAHPLVKKYGVIAAKRLFKQFPDLIYTALSSTDSDVKKFAKDFIDLSIDSGIQ